MVVDERGSQRPTLQRQRAHRTPYFDHIDLVTDSCSLAVTEHRFETRLLYGMWLLAGSTNLQLDMPPIITKCLPAQLWKSALLACLSSLNAWITGVISLPLQLWRFDLSRALGDDEAIRDGASGKWSFSPHVHYFNLASLLFHFVFARGGSVYHACCILYDLFPLCR